MVMIMSMRTSRTYILSGAWQLIPMDHLFLSVYRALLMLLRKHVLSRMVALSGPIPTSVAGYSGWILASALAQTPSPWFSIESFGGNSLFLGQNYPMMVKGDPTAVDTTLLPFMRSNCVYTSDIWVVSYPSTDIVGRFSLDDQSCVGFQIDNRWPVPESHLWFKASVSNAEDWLS